MSDHNNDNDDNRNRRARRYRKRTRDEAFQRQVTDDTSDSEQGSSPQRASSEDLRGTPCSEESKCQSSELDIEESDRGNGNEDEEVCEAPDLVSDGEIGQHRPDAADKVERLGENMEGEEVEAGEIETEASDGEDAEDSQNSESEGEDSDVSQDEDIDDINNNRPLYHGAQITLEQSAMTILSFVLSHNLTGTCISDLLSLIRLHCAPDNLCLKSLNLFKKHFALLGRDNIIRHYYCSVCEVPLRTKDSECATCQGRNDVQYFIEYSLISQLQTMFKRPGFRESLQFKYNRVKRNENNIEDVYDGKMYKENSCNGFLSSPNNISFTMYFDGVALYESSKFSMWPVYLSINELKYKDRVRKENVVIAGLWFGKLKPNPNLFLMPLWDKMHMFQTNGFDFQLPNRQVVRVKGRVLSAVGDLPAKALFMRMTQFNGLYSCFSCMSSGGRFDLGRGSVHIFPYFRNFEMRRNEDIADYANQAVIARQTDPAASVYGLKGPSIMSAFLPDLIRCTAIDVMHGVFQGLMKTLLELWFSSEHSNSAFSISVYVDIVDARLKSIKPPFNFQRMPRSIKTELYLFIASDLKLFFFFLSVPILLGVLPDVYWNHHCKIVSAITLLSQDSVSHEQIIIADELIHEYVSDFERLYSQRYLGLNLHQLLHLCWSVSNLGPTWVHTCFPYESLNGQLSKLVHGTRHAALQICSSSIVFMNLCAMVNKMEECEAKRLCLKFMDTGKKKVKDNEVIDNKTSVVGSYTSNHVPVWIRNLLREHFNIEIGKLHFF